jgi:hypothetical protein
LIPSSKFGCWDQNSHLTKNMIFKYVTRIRRYAAQRMPKSKVRHARRTLECNICTVYSWRGAGVPDILEGFPGLPGTKRNNNNGVLRCSHAKHVCVVRYSLGKTIFCIWTAVLSTRLAHVLFRPACSHVLRGAVTATILQPLEFSFSIYII